LSGGGDLTSDRTLSVDGSVVRTSGDQSVGGTKNFTGTLQVNGEEVVAGGGNEIEGMLTLSNTALGSSEKIVQFDVHRGFDIRRSATEGGASANLWLNAQVARNSWGVSYNDVEIVDFGTDGPTRFRKNVRFEEGANVTGSLTVDGDSVVSTSGDQSVGGTKNFTGTLQVNGEEVVAGGGEGKVIQFDITSSSTDTTFTVPSRALVKCFMVGGGGGGGPGSGYTRGGGGGGGGGEIAFTTGYMYISAGTYDFELGVGTSNRDYELGGGTSNRSSGRASLFRKVLGNGDFENILIARGGGGGGSGGSDGGDGGIGGGMSSGASKTTSSYIDYEYISIRGGRGGSGNGRGNAQDGSGGGQYVFYLNGEALTFSGGGGGGAGGSSGNGVNGGGDGGLGSMNGKPADINSGAGAGGGGWVGSASGGADGRIYAEIIMI
jgi:hypothetical protein